MEVSQLDSTTGYFEKHDMIEIIARERRIAAHELPVRLVFFLKGLPFLAEMKMILTVILMKICGLASENIHH